MQNLHISRARSETSAFFTSSFWPEAAGDKTDDSPKEQQTWSSFYVFNRPAWELSELPKKRLKISFQKYLKPFAKSLSLPGG